MENAKKLNLLESLQNIDNLNVAELTRLKLEIQKMEDYIARILREKTTTMKK